MCLATCVEPVKHDAGACGCGHQRRAHRLAGPVQQRSASRGHAGLVQQLRRSAAATPGVCSAGLAATALPATSAATTWPAKIASGKFHGLMQTNTPRPCRRSSLLSPVGPGSASGARRVARLRRRSSGRSRPPRAPRPRSRPGLAAFLHQQRAERAAAALRARRRRARSTAARSRDRRRVPAAMAALQRCHRGVDLGRRRFGAPRGTRAARERRRAAARARQARRGRRRAGCARAGPYRSRGSGCAGAGGSVQRRAQQLSSRHRVVGELVHERRVGAVLQQPPHQVGQQVAVLAHRRVDAQRHARGARCSTSRYTPSPMPCRRCISNGAPLRARHLHDGRDGAGVVRGELRVDHVACAEQRARAGQVGDVGVVLVREHRVARQPQLLRALDLAVPVGALDQPHHEAQAVRARDARHLVDDLQRARLVGLHRQAEAAPLRVRAAHVRGQRLEHLQRQLQPIALLGVDREVDVGARGQLARAATRAAPARRITRSRCASS